MLESEDEETKDETGVSALTVVKPVAVGKELTQEVSSTNAIMSADGIEDSHSVVAVQAPTTTTSSPIAIDTTTNGPDQNDVNRHKQSTSIESVRVTDDDTNRSIPVSSSLISSPLPLQPVQTSIL